LLFKSTFSTDCLKKTKPQIRTEANALDAAAQGAANAVFLVANIIANLIAFLAFIAFLNGVISWYGNLLGAPYITFEVFVYYVETNEKDSRIRNLISIPIFSGF
jgi:nucleoside permease NupC